MFLYVLPVSYMPLTLIALSVLLCPLDFYIILY